MNKVTLTPELLEWRTAKARQWLDAAGKAEQRRLNGTLAIDSEMAAHRDDCTAYANDYLNGRFDNEAGNL